MDLAQHLVECGIVRFSEGGFQLPQTLDAMSLPQDMQEALDARVAHLPGHALQLAQGLSLTVAAAPLELDEYAQLLPADASSSDLLDALDALVSAQVMVRAGERYVFRQHAMVEAVQRALPVQQRHMLHLHLADIYHRSSRQAAMLQAYHLFLGGEGEAAYQCMPRLTGSFLDLRGLEGRLVRSQESIEVTSALLEHAISTGKGEADEYYWRQVLVQLSAAGDPTLARYSEQVLPVLMRLTGLSHWDSLAELPPAERIGACLQRTISEHDAKPQAERWLHPFAAVEQLAQTVAMLTGTYAATWMP